MTVLKMEGCQIVTLNNENFSISCRSSFHIEQICSERISTLDIILRISVFDVANKYSPYATLNSELTVVHQISD